jgi:CRISPR-associated endonuclease Csn1
MKKILGLDLGTTSIGWALVHEAESENEKSSIVRVGVRIVPLTSDEANDFQKGKSTTLNANRTSKRGARRNLHRYKQRRKELKKVLFNHNIITDTSKLTNDSGKRKDPHAIWELRAKAASTQIGLEELARVLFAINKKRGYKSNRKAKDEGDGQAVDGMALAKRLYEENITPGQLMLQRLNADKKGTPNFYRFDLQNEFDKIWFEQHQHYPNLLTLEIKEKLFEKSGNQTYRICEEAFGMCPSCAKIQFESQSQRVLSAQCRATGCAKIQRLGLKSLV